jgi:hypothetical protein
VAVVVEVGLVRFAFTAAPAALVVDDMVVHHRRRELVPISEDVSRQTPTACAALQVRAPLAMEADALTQERRVSCALGCFA